MVFKEIILLFIVAFSTHRSKIKILLFVAATVSVVTTLAVVSVVDDLDFVVAVAAAVASIM
jgi:uncharacterized membrane protein YjjB (DUF3815 family)